MGHSIGSSGKTYGKTPRQRNPQKGLVQGSNDDKRNHYSHLFSYSRIILSSGVNDEPVLQEGKSQESIGRSRSVFSTPTIPTGNQVTKSVNKPHYPKSFGNGGIEITRQYAKISTNFLRFNSVSLCRQYYV